MSKKPIHRKIIAGLLVSSLLILDLPLRPDDGAAFAVSEYTVKSADKSGKQTFNIPRELGQVTGRFYGQSGRFVVLIQDLHCVPEAQKNIGKIIQFISQRDHFKDVTLEGAMGQVDALPLASFPAGKKRDAVLETLLNDSSLSGAEWIQAQGKEKLNLWGVEDPVYYRENLSAFIQSEKMKGEKVKILSLLGSELEEIKRRELPENLFLLDEAYWKYREGAANLDFIFVLLVKEAGMRKQRLPPAIRRYHRLARLSKKINPDDLNAELGRFLESLIRDKSQKEVKDWLRRVLSYRLERLSEEDFFSELSVKASQTRVPMRDYRQLSRYFAVVHLRSIISVRELDAAVQSCVRQWVSEVPGKWFEETERLYVLRNFWDLKLSSEEWEQFLDGNKKKDLLPFIFRYLPEKDIDGFRENLNQWFSSSQLFYKTAQHRNTVLAENTLQKMKEKNLSSAFLVAGGFHEQGVTAWLKAHDVSYVVILPKTSSWTSSLYSSRLRAQPVGLEKLIVDSASGTGSLPFQTSMKMLAPAVRTAIDPMVYQHLRLLIFEKAYLLYELLCGLEPDASVEMMDQARESFLSTLAGAERDEMSKFLKDLKVERLNTEGRQIWLRMKFGNSEWFIVMGQKSQDDPLRPDENNGLRGMIHGSYQLTYAVLQTDDLLKENWVKNLKQVFLEHDWIERMVALLKMELHIKPWGVRVWHSLRKFISRNRLMISVALGTVALDWLSKYWISTWAPSIDQAIRLSYQGAPITEDVSFQVYPIIEDYVNIALATHRMSSAQVLARIIITPFILLFLQSSFSHRMTRWYKIGMGLMLGGMFANTLELIFLGGVLDWLAVGNRSVFVINLADFMTIMGGGILLLQVNDMYRLWISIWKLRRWAWKKLDLKDLRARVADLVVKHQLEGLRVGSRVKFLMSVFDKNSFPEEYAFLKEMERKFRAKIILSRVIPNSFSIKDKVEMIRRLIEQKPLLSEMAYQNLLFAVYNILLGMAVLTSATPENLQFKDPAKIEETAKQLIEVIDLLSAAGDPNMRKHILEILSRPDQRPMLKEITAYLGQTDFIKKLSDSGLKYIVRLIWEIDPRLLHDLLSSKRSHFMDLLMGQGTPIQFPSASTQDAIDSAA